MFKRILPASPNWYSSRCSDVSSTGLLGVGAKNVIYLIQVSVSDCTVVGELLGHRDLVSGFSFCHHPAQTQLCASASHDGTIRFWDSDSRSFLKEHAAHQSSVTAIDWSPLDKNLLVSGDEKGIMVCHWFHTGETCSFFPEPRTIFCLSCSPHTWSCVAVGYKDGMIILIDVSKKGHVTNRLRGHDDEIHSLAWCPQLGLDALCCPPEDGAVTRGESPAEGRMESYLSSGSKDQTLRIWNSANGKAVLTLKLPYLKRRGSAVDPSIKERLWLTVLWMKSRPGQVLSSCFSGELLHWDLNRSGKQRWTVLGTSSEGQNHSRIVFNMSSVLLHNRELLVSTSMDREIKCWDLSCLDCCWTLPTLGGFVYTLTFSPVGGANCLALGVGDNMIRVWNTLSTKSQYETKTFWQGIKSKVTALAWHPKKEGTLAFGTDDGKVGIYEIFSNKPPQISSSYHRKTVYTLAWGPPVPPVTSASGEKVSLYSCAGEGIIYQHDPTKLNTDASDIDQLIRETNNIQHKLPPHSDLCWKPDGKVLAVGNEDGSIDIYLSPRLRLLCSIQQHHKIINCLRWHPGHAPSAEVHALLASGSSNAVVFVHDLHSVLANRPEPPPVLTEPFRKLAGHTAKITGLAWSPHHDAQLVSVSYDGTAQVWDVLQEVAVANYRGHMGYLLCVDWSPVDPDLVWTGGKDFTVQEWNVSEQEFSKPPKGKKLVELKEKKKMKKNNKKSSAVRGAEPEEEKVLTAQEVSGDEEEGDVSSAVSASCETQRKTSSSSSSSSSAAAKIKEKTDPVLLQQKKKPRSLFPLTSSLNHGVREKLLQDCVTLAKLQHWTHQDQDQDQDHQETFRDLNPVEQWRDPPPQAARAPPTTAADCVPGQGDLVHLGLFSDKAALQRMFTSEEDTHLEAGHFDCVVYLRLWSGDLQGALQLAADRGELSDHLLSLAPMAGFKTWQRTVDVYVQQLCRQQNFLKAASHLLSLNRVYEALELLKTHRFYREAVCLAKARLSESDPLLQQLYNCWAAALEKDGHFSSAAKCLLAAGATFDAAKVLSRKSDASSLQAAADVARICGEIALAQTLALRCSKELMVTQKWVAAQEVLRPYTALLVQQLILVVTELLTTTLEEAAIAIAPGGVHHQWACHLTEHATLLERVKAVWTEHFGVSRQSSGRSGAAALLQDLQLVESPTLSVNSALTQVLMMTSVHLTAAVLGWLQDNSGQLITGLWRAVTSLTDAGNFSVAAAVLKSLFPEGADISKQQETLGDADVAAVDSLQAIVLYHRLYERWWACPRPTDTIFDLRHDVISCSDRDQPTDDVIRRDLCLLLSERHAALQANQRRAHEIQQHLSAMVTQHKHNRPTEPTSAAEDCGKCEDQETFLSLSLKLTQTQRKVDQATDAVKMFPRPDVMECCLLLLNASRSLSISEELQLQAKELLQKYATSPHLMKASRRFLT
ncbi:gem-associated protein 5 isoform X2 [Cynoglossus semilaevis]|uniref:gem-associated protein 5 isoform X2 n=1 Tax=Cynoglossus semilaevis TaxID=244447 RepID=UPI000D62C396|nr:gem-associated protein 5 isoform X2 [Cynoglossus semilaevis]